ncbi:MAG: class I SAM-dependent methyltransferase [Magnetospirillum sp.]|nr:MAG: class I SAM-dependent methyltransferase [Magnetospirillum sp.]
MTESAPGFYGTYASHKGYATPEVGPKQIRRFDAEIWRPAVCSSAMSFLEIGCGTGAFLAYLQTRGVRQMLGIDHDPALAAVIPEAVRDRFSCRDANDLLADQARGPFDRVVMLDVLEHFSPEDARHLLQSVRGRLTPGGKVVIKVPNAGGPWGLQYQFGDLTHRTAFSPISLRQLADAAGYGPPLIYGQRQGSRRRLITDALVHRFLSWALLNPPEFWSANLYAVFPLRAEP